MTPTDRKRLLELQAAARSGFVFGGSYSYHEELALYAFYRAAHELVPALVQELERLEGERKVWEQKSWDAGWQACLGKYFGFESRDVVEAERDALRAENERIRQELEQWSLRARNETEWRTRAEKDVHNLRTENERLEGLHRLAKVTRDNLLNEALALRAENERLRDIHGDCVEAREYDILRAENERLRNDVRRLREERDWYEDRPAFGYDWVEVELLTGADLVELGCCCASKSPDWTDVTKGCTDHWLKKNGA